MYRSRYDWTPDFRAQEIPLDVTEVMSTSRNMGSFISESVEEEVFLLKAYVQIGRGTMRRANTRTSFPFKHNIL